MNTKLSERFDGEKLEELQANFKSAATLSLMSKAIESTGRVYTFVVSTPDMDRQGDELDQTKWDFTLFKMNPVALWSHQYDQPPIGAWSNIRQQGGRTLMDLRCVPGSVYPFAGQIEAMIDMGFLNACSVGFMINKDGTYELLEVSPCSVGANAYALAERDAAKYALDIPMLVAKGFSFRKKETEPKVFEYDITVKAEAEIKAEQVGDRCELDDGTPGVLAEDEDNPGAMVCVPPEEGKGQETKKTMKKELLKKLKAENVEHEKNVDGHVDAMEEKMKKASKATGVEKCAKAIGEYEKAVGGENDRHEEACMKAIDDSWKLPDQADEEKSAKKDLEEFKAKFGAEHEKHVAAHGKAIDELKDAVKDDHEDAAEAHVHEDAIDELKDAVGDEQDRHEKAHKAIVKAQADPEEEPEETEEKKDVAGKKGVVEDIFMQGAEGREKGERLGFIQAVMWALCDAVWSSDVEDFFELLEEAIGIIEDYAEHEKNGETDADEQAEGQSQGKKLGKFLSERIKSGRKISAATEKAISMVCDALEAVHEKHGDDIEKAIADLKAIAEGPGEGEEGDGQKAGVAPNKKVGSAKTNPMSEDFNSAMLARDILAAVNTATKGGLEKLNEKFGRHFAGRR